MKKALLIAVAVSLLAGCAGRPLNDYDRAAILGASEKQAMENARDAVTQQDKHRDAADDLFDDLQLNKHHKGHHHHE